MRTIEIYLRRNSQNTKILVEHIAQYIDVINKTTIINFNYVTRKNEKLAYEKGIESFPSLFHENVRIVGLKEILSYITPANYNPEYKSENEMINDLQEKWLMEGDDDDIDGEVLDQDEIHKKMQEIQKKRPKMNGVEDKIEGGRDIKSKKIDTSEIQNDDEFLNKIGDSDNIATQEFDNSGQNILDNYYSHVL